MCSSAFAKLIGHVHPTIWRSTDSIQMDQPQVVRPTAQLEDQRVSEVKDLQNTIQRIWMQTNYLY